MAASASCNSSIGPSIARCETTKVQQQQRPSLFQPLNSIKSCNGSAEDADVCITSTPFVPNPNQACRLVSLAVAATAWAGLSMCPLEVSAMVYETDHRNVDEWVVGMLGGNLDTRVAFAEGTSIQNQLFMKDRTLAPVGNVPLIQPPNEGLNSPWIPKLNGLKKGGNEAKRRAARCPPWSMSELEMVLPDLHGKPKPVPRMQGQAYPFWPASSSSSSSSLMAGNADISKDGSAVHERDGSKALPLVQQHQSPNMIIKRSTNSCFTL